MVSSIWSWDSWTRLALSCSRKERVRVVVPPLVKESSKVESCGSGSILCLCWQMVAVGRLHL